MRQAIGKLRHRVRVQTSVPTQDDFGKVTLTWSTVATRWCSIEPLAGRELWSAQQVSPDVTMRIVMRYMASLTSAHRLLFGARTIQIESVLSVDEVADEMVLLCREVR